MMYTKKEDGLKQPWHGRVWLNPPFGRQWPLWVEKLINHGNGIALLHARTETEPFFNLCWRRADAIFFLEGRIHFHRPNGKRARANSGAPIALVAFGSNNVDAIVQSQLHGSLVMRGGYHLL